MIRFTSILAGFLLLSVRPMVAQASNYALIVSSASGNSEFKEKFWNWSSQMMQVLKDEMRIPRENIVLLTEDPSQNAALVNGKATKAELAKAFDGLVAEIGPHLCVGQVHQGERGLILVAAGAGAGVIGGAEHTGRSRRVATAQAKSSHRNDPHGLF